MKKIIMISVSAILVIALVVVAAIYIVSHNSSVRLAPVETSDVNYNNYAVSDPSFFDSNGKYAVKRIDFILSGYLVVADKEGNREKIFDVGPMFQLTSKGFVHSRGSCTEMKYYSFDTKNTVVLAEDVRDFIVYNDAVVYRVEDSDDLYHSYDLYYMELSNGKPKLLMEDAYDFWIYSDKVYVLQENGFLSIISLIDGKTQATANIEIPKHSFDFISGGENIVVYLDGNDLVILSFVTGEKKTVCFDDSEYEGNYLSFICNEEVAYVSFQATKTTKTETVEEIHTIKSHKNGVYKVDLKTLQKEKICDEAFDKLFLLDNDKLFGRKTFNGVYKFDVEAKTYKKVD